MKAIALTRTASGASLALRDMPVPEIGDTEVLVRIAAFGVGTHDRWFLPEGAPDPYVIGIEGAGVIERTGAAVTGHAPGDRVMFVSSQNPKGGTWAEYAAVAASSLIPIPYSLGFAEAVALPVAGGMALEGVRALGLAPGEALVVAGGSGAIGTLAIQLAAGQGARVAATASPPNHALLRALGAEAAFDYRAPDLARAVQDWRSGGADAALAIPAGTGPTSLPLVRDGGRIVTISGDRVTPLRAITVTQASHSPDKQALLAGLARDVAEGRIRAVIDRRWPLEEATAALEKVETGHASGKQVVVIGQARAPRVTPTRWCPAAST